MKALGLAALILMLPEVALAKNCKVGKPCGNACIATHKKCRVGKRARTRRGRVLRRHCEKLPPPKTKWFEAGFEAIEGHSNVGPTDQVAVVEKARITLRECASIACAALDESGGFNATVVYALGWRTWPICRQTYDETVDLGGVGKSAKAFLKWKLEAHQAQMERRQNP